jgi:hypothetical protein
MVYPASEMNVKLSFLKARLQRRYACFKKQVFIPVSRYFTYVNSQKGSIFNRTFKYFLLNIISMSETLKPLPLTVPAGDAITWTTNWRDSDHHLTADSFLISVDDFKAIIKEHGVKFVRLYLGLRVSKDDNTLQEKLLCVGVDKDRKDIIHIHGNNGGEQETNSDLIYDFSHPCPPLCQDPESPLAGGTP